MEKSNSDNKTKVLFVCRDNLTRSLTAEFCFKDFLLKNNIENVIVDSAVLRFVEYEKIYDNHLKVIKGLGIDCSFEVRKIIDNELLESSDLIISMAQDIQKELLDSFHTESILFNKICCDEETSVTVDWSNKDRIDLRLEEMVLDIKKGDARSLC